MGTGTLRSVKFELWVGALRPGVGTGTMALEVAHLTVVDFTLVRYKGFVEVDGVRAALDALRTNSVHSRERLPTYAYLVTVRRRDEADPKALLLGAIRRDDLRIGGELLGERTLFYAHAHGMIPPFSLHVGDLRRSIPLSAGGWIELSDILPVPHEFFGQPAGTATATARHYPPISGPTDLGRVILDCRGEDFVRALARS